uniref:Uncharacterized protein n=1 Tax=Coccolithus braarudii TaxID=221442 RepID=A0A7S0PYF1_9EUKA|mmetsp:Transcript_22233/g.48014  ORF Transcript_22233/g.48014 Transcript_22233/m.48014 type:complete len:221 (+) Transcript_22233:246-908(+)
MRWAVLTRRGLVSNAEQDDLAVLRKAGAALCGMCHGIVDQWHRSGRLSEFQAKQLNEHIGGARGLAAKQIAFEITGVPFPFFHLLTWTMIFLILMLQVNSACRFAVHILDDNCDPATDPCRELSSGVERVLLVGASVEVIGLGYTTPAFKSIWHTALYLTNPYGEFECDYDIDIDLQQLWVKSLELLNRMPRPRTAAMRRFTDSRHSGIWDRQGSRPIHT